MTKFLIKLFLIAISVIAPFLSARAAVLYFDPAEGEYGEGDIFSVNIKIDLESADGCINTIEGVVGFDKEFLEAVDFSVGESILSLWLNLPAFKDMPTVNKEKALKFTGGVPGGYCGKIPGDPGESNIVGKIFFKVNSGGNENLNSKANIYFLENTKVLLNDGFGTEANVFFKNAEVAVKDTNAEPKREWENQLALDNIPPEPFILEIQQDPKIYGGKYYLLFNTADKQTGIDHYEVKETKIDETTDKKSKINFLTSLFKEKKEMSEWKLTSLPYILEDQKLESIIEVKAVDKAGNERIAEYFPSALRPQNKGTLKMLIILLLLIIAVVVVAILCFYKHLKHKREKRNRIY